MEGIAKKAGLGQFADLRVEGGGLGKKEGGVFEGMYTIYAS